MKRDRLPEELECKAMTLLESCRTELQSLIGKVQRDFTSIEILQSDVGPCIGFDGDRVTIFVGPNATACESALVANVAHESVHLHLTDGRNGYASGLEEGFALHFELSIVEKMYGRQERLKHIDHLPRTYPVALSDYEHLLTLSDTPAIAVLESCGKLTGVSPRQLRQVFANLGWLMSRRLARRKQMRPL